MMDDFPVAKNAGVRRFNVGAGLSDRRTAAKAISHSTMMLVEPPPSLASQLLQGERVRFRGIGRFVKNSAR
jgi:hypothetical protein